MEFEAAWAYLNKHDDLDTIDELEMFKKGYRAGLRQAAEQDKAKSASFIPPDGHIGRQYLRSAIMHEQAAHDIK